MKKIFLLAGIFFLVPFSSVACEFYLMRWHQDRSLTFNYSNYFYLSPKFSHSAFRPGFEHILLRQDPYGVNFFAKAFEIPGKSVYNSFQSMQFKFPDGAVFCRMENEFTKHHRFMFSIHAGGYSER